MRWLIELRSLNQRILFLYWGMGWKVLHERANMGSSAKDEKTIEIAKNLLDVLDVETIAIKTGLSVEEVKNLKH